jgi:hypothetical protein
MSETIITIENLSKSYLLGHQTSQYDRYKYTALRDLLGRIIRNFARKATDMTRGRLIVQGDKVEEFRLSGVLALM